MRTFWTFMRLLAWVSALAGLCRAVVNDRPDWAIIWILLMLVMAHKGSNVKN